VLLAGEVNGAAAQLRPPLEQRTPPVIRYGKWGSLALAAGFTALGIRTHNNADDAFRNLAAYCRLQTFCAVGPDGRYTDPEAERRYGEVVSGDRWARAWLVSGQAALLGSVVLFVMELKRDRGPRNVPYSPLIMTSEPGGARVGLRLPLPR
jgi:hypothetical protein